MFPDVQGQPAQASELAVLASISFDVRHQLRHPPLMVVLGQHAVCGAPVPKAAVDEDSDPGSTEGHIRRTWKIAWVQSVSEAEPVQLSAKRHLWPAR
jgi:hypothetical protein